MNKYRYILFYKPYGVLSQFTDRKGSGEERVSGRLILAENSRWGVGSREEESDKRSTLQDYIPVPSVYPVGRLDWDSEGLLLLTNHGQLQHRLSHPRFHHPRTYWVQVERIPSADAITQLQQGVLIQNYQTRPTQVQLLDFEPALPPRNPPIRFRKNVPTAWLEMTLTEGRNRQVRRMTALVGFPTLRLVRVAIAHLRLEDLQPGQWRDLTLDEVKLLAKK